MHMHLHTVTYTHIHTYSDIYKHIQMDAQYLFDVALPKRLSTNLISACFNSTCWVEQDNGGFLKHGLPFRNREKDKDRQRDRDTHRAGKKQM